MRANEAAKRFGFRVSGIAPTNDPAWALLSPDGKIAYHKVAQKEIANLYDEQLAQGLDRLGRKLIPVTQYTREHRRSAMVAVADPDAPPFVPGHAASRTRSFVRFRPDEEGVLVYWKHDPRVRTTWGQILYFHSVGAVKGRKVRDVLGLMPRYLELVRRRMARWWMGNRARMLKAHAGPNVMVMGRAKMPGKVVSKKVLPFDAMTVHKDAKGIPRPTPGDFSNEGITWRSEADRIAWEGPVQFDTGWRRGPGANTGLARLGLDEPGAGRPAITPPRPRAPRPRPRPAAPAAVAPTPTPASAPIPEPIVLPVEIRGDVSPDLANRARAYVDSLSDRVKQTLVSRGAKIAVGRRFGDVLPDLADVHPRGWPEGLTWSHVDGGYVEPYRLALACEEVKDDRSGEFVRSTRTIGVLSHETGHAYDHALDRFSGSSEFRQAYTRDVESLSERDKRFVTYYLQPGQAGPEEVFAELFGRLTGNGADPNRIEELFSACAELLRSIL